VAAVLAGAQAAVILTASRAMADPSPTPSTSTSSNPCDAISGIARQYCDNGDGTAKNGTTSVPNPLDPLTSLAQGCAKAASAVIGKLSEAVTHTTEVDFTNTAFLRQYAVVFAASTILTLVLWLLAVAKRAVRGVPLTEALTEASASSG
jgi:hypothetical protein